jgi:hypothetical protein
VARSVDSPANLERLVEHMFDQVLGPLERAELLSWIAEWEKANPDVDAAHRVTGWIDVAYAYQAYRDGRVVRTTYKPNRPLRAWSPTPSLI